MKKFYAIMFVVVFMLNCNNVFAFDGERKGFILGGGIGGGFLSNIASVGSFSNTESEGVFLTNFKIGYAPSNTLEIFYVSKVSWWGESDFLFTLGLSSVTVTFYFNETSETGWFASGGVGLSSLAAPLEEDIGTDYGFGLFGGGGYEFAAHWSVEVDLLYSMIKESGVDFNSFGVLVSVNFLAF